jgi:hypothetical protein
MADLRPPEEAKTHSDIHNSDNGHRDVMKIEPIQLFG